MATIIAEAGFANGMLRNFRRDDMRQYPFIFSSERKHKLQRHLVFWIAWVLFFAFIYSFRVPSNLIPPYPNWAVALLEAIFFLAAHIFCSYSLMYFVIPRYLLKGKYTNAFAGTLAVVILTGLLSTVITMYVLPPVKQFVFNIETLPAYKTTNSFHFAMMAGLRGGITVGGLAAAIKLMKYWYVKDQRNLQLQKENLESQLQLLKAQVHPHFLFNTLNNIYSYTQNTSPVAARLVTGLSDMLRFILYDANETSVPLSRELKLLQNYIDLENIRYGNKLEMHVDLPTNTANLHIAPLLLLPLIENSFKHGTSKMIDQPWINLQISVHGQQMHMKLMNGKAKQEADIENSRGIGIQNVQKRLDILYPGKHQLSITNEEEIFIVNLKITLEQKPEIVPRRINIPEPADA